VTVRRPASPPRPAEDPCPAGDPRRAGRSTIGRRPFVALGGGARLLVAGLLGASAAVLVSCGSTGAGLIPAENAGPLVADFQAVEKAALKGGGDCSATEAALRKTVSDFQTLPRSVNAGLRAKLHQGIVHLHGQALELCREPLSQTTTTGESTATTGTTPPTTTTTKSSTAPTGTTPTTSTTGTTPSGTTPNSGTEGGTAPELGGSEGKPGESPAGNGQGGAGSGEVEEQGAANGGAGVPSGGSGQ
jgi:hypothetical protein